MDEKVIEKVKVWAMSSLLHRNVLGALGMLLFALLAFNIGWLFTRGQNELNNKIYKVCS